MMKLDLLAIAAHPDDVEVTCGGTMLKMAEQGYRTGILDLTAGEMGTRGSIEVRRREASAAAKILRVAHRETLGLPDARLALDLASKMAVARKIRALRPHCVILPYWEARHPDHYTASRIGYEGCFLAGLKRLEMENEPFRPFKIIYSMAYSDVRPTFVVDITRQFERRRRAILAFGSQFRPKPGQRRSKVYLAIDLLEAQMNLYARHYGQMIGTQYGEAFLVRELMQVDDIVKMPVRSI